MMFGTHIENRLHEHHEDGRRKYTLSQLLDVEDKRDSVAINRDGIEWLRSMAHIPGFAKIRMNPNAASVPNANNGKS